MRVLNLLNWLYRKYSKTPHISINWPRSHMYLYDAEPNFSLEVRNPRFLICGINCGHKWSISTEKVRTSIYIFSSYLTDTFAFKLNLSILICVFPAYNIIIEYPLYWKCLDFLNVDVYKFEDSIPSPCWKLENINI